MDYEELIAKALKGRSVNSVAKMWGLNQATLSRYVHGRLPDYNTALHMATDAGIDPAEALKILARKEREMKVENFKLQMGFVQTELLALLTVVGGLTVSILCQINQQTRSARNGVYRLYRLYRLCGPEITTLATSTNRMAS